MSPAQNSSSQVGEIPGKQECLIWSSGDLGTLGTRFGEKIGSGHLGIGSMLNMMDVLLERSILVLI
jgi:hypothetical protein